MCCRPGNCESTNRLPWTRSTGEGRREEGEVGRRVEANVSLLSSAPSSDDEYITRDAYLIQPPTQTAIIVGFNIISRIFAVLGEIVALQRETRRCPPVGPEGIIKKLREVVLLMTKTVKLLKDSPPAFSMKKSFNSAANS